jgi:hypothetical protein
MVVSIHEIDRGCHFKETLEIKGHEKSNYSKRGVEYRACQDDIFVDLE